MPWNEDVADVVRRIVPTGGTFTLDDVYRYRQELRDLHADNAHVDDKIRQCLQHLRDSGMIEFTDGHGNYRRLT